MSNTKLIFGDLNIQVDENQPLCFNEVIVDTMKDNYSVYCGCEQLITVDYYQHILAQLEQRFVPPVNKVRLFLQPKNNQISQIDKQVLNGYLTYFLSQKPNLASILQHLNISELETSNNSLEIHVPIVINQISLQPIIKYFVVILQRLGIEFDEVKFKQTLSEEEVKEQVKKQQESYRVEKPKQQAVTSCEFGNIPSNMKLEPIIDVLEDPLPETTCLIGG